MKYLILIFLFSGSIVAEECQGDSCNLLGKKLQDCSTSPMTGYSRSGSCDYYQGDSGRHLVCAQVTKEFLDYTKSKGNDLSTPSPRYGFQGLKPGDRWCLCSARYLEAKNAGIPLKMIKSATNAKAFSD